LIIKEVLVLTGDSLDESLERVLACENLVVLPLFVTWKKMTKVIGKTDSSMRVS
jgi:hypothetical protein